jgi:hypothetical protein
LSTYSILKQALRVATDIIAQGLGAFTTTYDQNPGRFNIADQHPFRVILHTADGSEAVREMSSVVAGFPAPAESSCSLRRQAIGWTTTLSRWDGRWQEASTVAYAAAGGR